MDENATESWIKWGRGEGSVGGSNGWRCLGKWGMSEQIKLFFLK